MPVRLIAHRVNAARVDPAIVEVEQRADRDGVIDGFIRIAGLVQSFDIQRLNGNGIAIDLADEAEQRFLGIGKRRTLWIGQNSRHEFLAA